MKQVDWSSHAASCEARHQLQGQKCFDCYLSAMEAEHSIVPTGRAKNYQQSLHTIGTGAGAGTVQCIAAWAWVVDLWPQPDERAAYSAGSFHTHICRKEPRLLSAGGRNRQWHSATTPAELLPWPVHGENNNGWQRGRRPPASELEQQARAG